MRIVITEDSDQDIEVIKFIVCAFDFPVKLLLEIGGLGIWLLLETGELFIQTTQSEVQICALVVMDVGKYDIEIWY